MKHNALKTTVVPSSPRVAGLLWVVAALVVVAVACPPYSFAQTFPEQERLDVLDLRDGSTLIGQLVDEDGNPIDADALPDPTNSLQGPSQPITSIRIEIAGGSVFVVRPGNIDRIRTIRNPDYGKEPDEYTVDPRAVLRAIYGEEAYPLTESEGSSTASPRAAKSDLANTTIIGYYFAPAVSWHGGADWEAEKDALDGGEEVVQFVTVGETGFTLHHFFDPFGIRTSVTLFSRNGNYDGEYEDQFGNTMSLDHHEQYSAWAANLDFLLGTGPPRRRWYAGVGVGWLIPAFAASGYDESELENPPLDSEFQDPAISEDPQPFGIYATLSGGVLLAMGRSWTAEFRLAYDTSLTSIYPTRLVTASGVTLGVGLGYRLR